MATAVPVKYWCTVCNEYTESSVTCDACGVAFDVEALKPSHNSQSTPLCACGQPAVKVLCDNCFCDEVFASTKKRA
jgi:hypothetical protein